MNEQDNHGLADSRRSAHGWARLLLVLVVIAAAVFAWMAVVGSTTMFQSERLATAVISVIAAAAWVAMAAGLIHNGRKMRRVAIGTATANTVMPFVTLAVSDFPIDKWSPWHDGGVSYWYVPTVLAALSIAWLYHSSPARLARRNG